LADRFLLFGSFHYFIPFLVIYSRSGWSAFSVWVHVNNISSYQTKTVEILIFFAELAEIIPLLFSTAEMSALH